MFYEFEKLNNEFWFYYLFYDKSICLDNCFKKRGTRATVGDDGEVDGLDVSQAAVAEGGEYP